jgi:hypothetical protein
MSNTGNGLARAERAASGVWQVEHLLADQDVRCLAADPRNRDVVYAGTQGNGVLRSIDRGKTWQPAGLSDRIVKSIAISPTEPGTIYAGTKPPLVFVSRDGCANWGGACPRSGVFSRGGSGCRLPSRRSGLRGHRALASPDPAVIVAGIEAGAVVRSADGGKHGGSSQALRDCHSITFHATKGDWVYEGVAQGRPRSAAMPEIAGRSRSRVFDRHYGWAAAAIRRARTCGTCLSRPPDESPQLQQRAGVHLPLHERRYVGEISGVVFSTAELHAVCADYDPPHPATSTPG